MRKTIPRKILCFFSACCIIILFSGCASNHHSHRHTFTLAEKDAERFAGSIRTRHGDAESHYQFGCYLQERNRHRPAIQEFLLAVEIDPAHVEALNAIGVSHDALGNHDLAVEAYKTALGIDPGLDYVLNNLGYSYLIRGRAELAAIYFREAVDLDQGNELYRNNLGLAYAEGGNFDAALAEFKQGGDEARARYNIARLYYRAGRYEEAEVHFLAASLVKSPDAKIERGVTATRSLSGIFAKRNESAEAPAPVPAVARERGSFGIDHAGFYTIPPEALSTFERVEIVEHRADRIPVYRAALDPTDYWQEMRKSLQKSLEDDLHAALNGAQALELLSLKDREDRNGSSRIRIEVTNGNGVRRMARNVGKFLRGKDVALMYLSNAPHFRHQETVIYYAPGYLKEAYELAQRLPGRQTLEEVTAIRNGNAEISILVGRDLVPHRKRFTKG